MKMDKPNKSFCKTLEVVWNRNNNNIRGSKMFPLIKGINIEDSEIKVKKFKSDEINENSTHKRIKRCLFQEDKNKKVHKLSDSNKLNKKKYKRCVTSLKNRPDNSSPQILFPRSPQIISTQERLISNQNTLENEKSIKLSPTHHVAFPHQIVDRINPNKSELYILESPEIMLNQKRNIEYNNLNNTNVSNNDKFNMNLICTTQLSKELNEKSNKLNIHLSNVSSKSNSMSTEYLIESSEISFSANKQKFKKRKIRCSTKCEKRKINNNDTNQIHVLEYPSDEKNRIKLQRNELKVNKEIEKTNKYLSCDKINFNSLNNIKILNSPVIEAKINSISYKSKKSTIEPQLNLNRDIKTLFKIEDDHIHHSKTYLSPLSVDLTEYADKIVKDKLQLFQPHKSEDLNQNKAKNILFPHSSDISIIPATPEHDVIVNTGKIEYSPLINSSNLNSYVPLIEVDQSPKTQNGNNCHLHIQSIQTPPNINCATPLPCLFEPVTSPTQLFSNHELPFKIDLVESPKAAYENENFISPEICSRKKSYNNCSPDCFDSTKKRKKICKDGLRGKFQDLIHRRKSEARIKEYEKSLSKNYQPKQGETALLNIIESWKEFKTFVLLCYHIESETRVQKVLVTLDNCPKNATKNSIISIHSPWLTIKSKTLDILLFVGIVHAEVIEFSGPTRSLGPLGLFTNINGLLTTVFQSDVLWKCKCSKDVACQCLGELSVFNYLRHMISY